MDIENHCEKSIVKKDGEYIIYCSLCDRLCIERCFRIHLKSQTHTNNIHKRENSIKYA